MAEILRHGGRASRPRVVRPRNAMLEHAGETPVLQSLEMRIDVYAASSVAALFVFCATSEAANGRIQLGVKGSEALVQVLGDKDHDWRIQASSDLLN